MPRSFGLLGARKPPQSSRPGAGTYCEIRVQNRLSTTSAIAGCHYHENSFHCADTTTLHTHGLHVAPTQATPLLQTAFTNAETVLSRACPRQPFLSHARTERKR